MKIKIAENLTDSQKEIIFNLWNKEYPVNLNFAKVADFEAFLQSVSEHIHYLLTDESDNLKGWLMAFTRQDERWFSVIIDGKEKQKGYGTRLLEELKINETEINGWAVEHDNYQKNNGETYRSPIGFYEKNGFQILPNIKLEKPDYYCVKINWKKSL